MQTPNTDLGDDLSDNKVELIEKSKKSVNNWGIFAAILTDLFKRLTAFQMT